MTWVRFDDQFPIHRKVKGLTDAEYRLATEAIFWCARNLTDGHVARDELRDVSGISRPERHLARLVLRGLWHDSGQQCTSDKCPPRRDSFDGWVIHDYFEYQPSKAKVERERKAKAGRQARWLAKKTSRTPETSTDASTDASQDDAPPRPAPKEAGLGPERSPPAAPRPGGRGDEHNPDWRTLPAFGTPRDPADTARARRRIAELRAAARRTPPGGPTS